MASTASGGSQRKAVCWLCGGSTVVPESLSKGDKIACASCGAYITVGKTTFRVEGINAEDVREVATGLVAAQGDAETRAEARLRNPWAAGSFYLFVLLAVVGLLLVVTAVAPPWVLAPIFIGGLLAVTCIGALQLRQDDRLSEEGFLSLMALTFKRLPLVTGRGSDKA
jgi:hypothetical protein